MVSPTPWYDSKLVASIASSIVSILIFIAGQYLVRMNQRKNDRRNTLIMITQSNSVLFGLIYLGALNEEKIDFAKLREELSKTNVIFLLPPDLKSIFQELFLIFNTNPSFYNSNKWKIYGHLKSIVQKLNDYGVDWLGYK